MTRAEQLRWWREGYAAGLAAGARQRQEAGEAEHAIAVADFRDQRRADRQAVTDALVIELIDVLARALLGDAGRDAPGQLEPSACHAFSGTAEIPGLHGRSGPATADAPRRQFRRNTRCEPSRSPRP